LPAIGRSRTSSAPAGRQRSRSFQASNERDRGMDALGDDEAREAQHARRAVVDAPPAGHSQGGYGAIPPAMAAKTVVNRLGPGRHRRRSAATS
jgi:hypothetical protein